METIPDKNTKLKATELVLGVAKASIKQELVQKTTSKVKEVIVEENGRCYLKLTKKEIDSMPNNLNKILKELKTLNFEGDFITCVTGKSRKGHKEVTRYIPISPMMKKVLPLIDFDLAKNSKGDTIRLGFKKIFPKRHCHEFRYTFITRAKECGCNQEAVMLWAGHEFDKDVVTSRVDRGYTTYSKEYFLEEIKKVNYDLAKIS